MSRTRMTGAQRREQLLDVGRGLFADKGFDGTSVEEIAARAEVSKPVVYEHFGGKEGLYAVIVDREVRALLEAISGSLAVRAHPKVLLERATMALLGYVETSTEGFRILVRDSPVTQTTGTFATLIGDVAVQVEQMLEKEFTRNGFGARNAPMYAHMLVGMVALTGQWWLGSRIPAKSEVAAHIVNLAWHGLSGLEPRPTLTWDAEVVVVTGGAPEGRAQDEVDRIVAAWQRERADLDVAPLLVLSRVSRLAHHLDRDRREAFSASELDLWEFDVLAALRRAGDPHELSPSVLASATLVTSGTMTNRIDRLAGRGLVERHPDPADRRGVLVRLTAAGASRVDAALSALLERERATLSALPAEGAAVLAEALRTLLAPFEA